MRFDVASLDAEVFARLMTATVLPRPIAWVVTQASCGIRNAAPFSFFNALSSWPPILGIGIQPRADGHDKDTIANIRTTGELVVNLVAFAQAEAMNRTAAEHGPDVDELDLAGLDVIASEQVAPPRIAGAPVAYECRMRHIIDVDHGRSILLADVLVVHIRDEAVLDAAGGKIDGLRLDLVGRMHGRDQYLRARETFSLMRP